MRNLALKRRAAALDECHVALGVADAHAKQQLPNVASLGRRRQAAHDERSPHALLTLSKVFHSQRRKVKGVVPGTARTHARTHANDIVVNIFANLLAREASYI